jgi:hypothetical protein
MPAFGDLCILTETDLADEEASAAPGVDTSSVLAENAAGAAQ